jgi:hypothetical protein
MQSRALVTDHSLPSATERALPHDAWRSSVPTTGDVAAPSQMEQSVDVRGGLSQLVQLGSLRRRDRDDRSVRKQ